MLWCYVCIRIKSKAKTMNLFFSFEKYLKYIQNYLYLNTFTNECIWPKEKYLYLNTVQCIWPHTWPTHMIIYTECHTEQIVSFNICNQDMYEYVDRCKIVHVYFSFYVYCVDYMTINKYFIRKLHVISFCLFFL